MVASHVAQLAAPLVLLAPQPAGTVAAAVIIACSVVDTSLAGHLLPLPAPPALAPAPPWYEGLVIAYAVAVLALSYRPARNLISRRQLMNASFDPFHLVNTYGAFGSISRYRYELVIEGTADLAPGPQTQWLEYEFKGKPGNPQRRPPQVAPYHLRPERAPAAAGQSVPRPAAGPCPRPALPVPVHHLAAAAADRHVVGADSRGTISGTSHPARLPAPGR